MVLLDAKDISFSRGEKTIFSHVDLSIENSEIVIIKGPSGSGKTTLLRVLGGLLEPTEGNINRSWKMNDRIQICGFHFVDGPFLEYMSVLENLLMLEIFAGITLSREYLYELAEKFDISKLLSRKIESLSSGQRERVSLIRSFLHHPEIIFLDEPGSNLDHKMGKKVKEFLILEQKKGKSLVLSTHSNSWDKYAKSIIELPLYE